MTDINLESLLFEGRNEEVVAAWETQSDLIQKFPVAIIGALAFLGRLDEALMLFSGCRANLSRGEVVEVRFFLGVGSTRKSNYEKARQFFGENLLLAKKETNHRELFFIHQGIGFYRYINGRFLKSYNHAKKAYEAAQGGGFLFGRVLALDLYGHTSIRIGFISEGLKFLQRALHEAEKLGDGGVVSALQNTIAIHRAKYQLKAPAAIALLKKTYRALKTTDNYSRAMLLLELSSAYINAGQTNELSNTLSQAATEIYETQNYRQEVMLNLKFSYLNYLTGEYPAAINNLQICKRIINPKVDQILMLEILGLERNVKLKIDSSKTYDDLTQAMTKLARQASDYVHERIMYRATKVGTSWRRGEDLIGDLKDIEDAKMAVPPILESGFLGLLFSVLKVAPRETCIYLDLAPRSISILSQGSVRHVPMGPTGVLRNLLVNIYTGGPVNRETLINRLWGYDYHPLTHDPLIYGALSRLRSILSEYQNIIELSDQGYFIKKGVRIVYGAEEKPPTRQVSRAKNSTEDLIKPQENFIEGLNYRQNKILSLLDEIEFVDIKNCVEIFKVSNITACRDLTELTRKGLLTRVGRARATKYVKVANISR